MQSKGEILIYETPEKGLDIQVHFENETLWLSQKMIAELFDKDSDTIGLHIRNILSEQELGEQTTTELFTVVQQEGKRMVSREIKFYNLDMILSVGYRVSSKKGTQFRQWATQRLKDHLVKGYTLNEKRLQQVAQNMHQLEQAVKLIQQSGSSEQLGTAEVKGLMDKSYLGY